MQRIISGGFIIIVHKELISQNRVLKFIRADDQFMKAWCNNMTLKLQFFLVFPMNIKYQALADNDDIIKSNLLPMINSVNTPYQLWHNSTDPINLDLIPMLPFRFDSNVTIWLHCYGTCSSAFTVYTFSQKYSHDRCWFNITTSRRYYVI